MMALRIRPPEDDETPLSPEECRVAIREGHTMRPIGWASGLTRNFSLMSAALHRQEAIDALNETGPRGEAWL